MGVNRLDGGVAAESTSVPRCHLQLATLQVEGCKMPSICELDLPGDYYRDAALNVDELLVELTSSTP